MKSFAIALKWRLRLDSVKGCRGRMRFWSQNRCQFTTTRQRWVAGACRTYRAEWAEHATNKSCRCASHLIRMRTRMLHTHLAIRSQSLGWSISTDCANAQLVSTAEKV